MACQFFSWAVLAGNIPNFNAQLRVINKTTGQTKDISVKIGKPFDYQNIIINLSVCFQSEPNEIPESKAFLTIHDINAKDNAPLFSGWMLASAPEVSFLDHPIIDLWVLKCF